MGAMKQQHRQKQDPAAIIYTGRNCDKCGKPLTVEPGQGTEELQMHKKRCRRCSSGYARRRAKKVYAAKRQKERNVYLARYRAQYREHSKRQPQDGEK